MWSNDTHCWKKEEKILEETKNKKEQKLSDSRGKSFQERNVHR